MRDRSNAHLLQPVGYAEGVEYATEPQNRYQQWLRRNMGGNDLLMQHYTPCFSARQVEATATVPLRPKAFHVDLPEVLWPDHAKPGRKQTNKGEASFPVLGALLSVYESFFVFYSFLWSIRRRRILQMRDDEHGSEYQTNLALTPSSKADLHGTGMCEGAGVPRSLRVLLGVRYGSRTDEGGRRRELLFLFLFSCFHLIPS